MVFCNVSGAVFAQKKLATHVDYIEKYKNQAIQQMKKHNIPASITLSQGLLESGAGTSYLATNGNNHFGIKCADWTGCTIRRDDDLPNECFRCYKSVDESYEDHSLFLAKRSRYVELFTLNHTDYAGWARGLQKLGYATDKAYANKLISLIELYELYLYDKGDKSSSDNKQPLKRQTYIADKLLYVVAEDNDSFEKIAADLGFSVKALLKYNEAPEGFPLKKGDVVYLQMKNKKSSATSPDYIVKIGDSMHSIAQHFGIRMSSLYSLNKKKDDYVPAEGDVLKLR
jgi:LysM repeat protein